MTKSAMRYCDCGCHRGEFTHAYKVHCQCKDAKWRAEHRAEFRKTICPTPNKRAYETKGEAQEVEKEMRRKVQVNSDLTPYQCACGAWHLGHDYKRMQKRIRNVLNAGRRRRK